MSLDEYNYFSLGYEEVMKKEFYFSSSGIYR